MAAEAPDAVWKLVVLQSGCAKSTAARHLWEALIAPHVGTAGRLIVVKTLEEAQRAGLQRLPALFLQHDVLCIAKSRGAGRVYEGPIVLKHLPRLTEHLGTLRFPANGRPRMSLPVQGTGAPAPGAGHAPAAGGTMGAVGQAEAMAAPSLEPETPERLRLLEERHGVVVHDNGKGGAFLRAKSSLRAREQDEDDPSLDPSVAARVRSMRRTAAPVTAAVSSSGSSIPMSSGSSGNNSSSNTGETGTTEPRRPPPSVMVEGGLLRHRG